MYLYRKASISDYAELVELIALSVRKLARHDYSTEQIEAAIGNVWGVDKELIIDQTYFVVTLESGSIIACGGWGKRRKLFGASSESKNGLEIKKSPLLNPNKEPARIRAFFVHPEHIRHGIGRNLIKLCEDDARSHGFRKMELMATLPGYRLYKSCGYTGEKRVEVPVSGSSNLTHTCVPMSKLLQS